MPGNQKEAAKKRTQAFLKKNPNHFRDLAMKKKGRKNPSKTKFTKKNAAAFGAKGGSVIKRKRRTRAEIEKDRIKEEERVEKQAIKNLKKMAKDIGVPGVGEMEFTDEDLSNPYKKDLK